MKESILVLIKPCYNKGYVQYIENGGLVYKLVNIRGKIVRLYKTNHKEPLYSHYNHNYPIKYIDGIKEKKWYVSSGDYIVITKENRNLIKQYLKDKKK